MIGAPGPAPVLWALTWGQTRTGIDTGSFWQKRYYDRNVRDARGFSIKLRYLHRNPVTRGRVKDPDDWRRSSYRHARRKVGVIEIESEWMARDRENKEHNGPQRMFLAPG